MKNYKIVILPGDGIGPEITASAIEILKEVSKHSDIKFDFIEKVGLAKISFRLNGVFCALKVCPSRAISSKAILFILLGFLFCRGI